MDYPGQVGQYLDDLAKLGHFGADQRGAAEVIGHPNKKTLRPLSDHARGVLSEIARGSMPRQEINPGVADRLIRGELVEEIYRPSPYSTVVGPVTYLQITPAGIAQVEKW